MKLQAHAKWKQLKIQTNKKQITKKIIKKQRKTNKIQINIRKLLTEKNTRMISRRRYKQERIG